MTIPNYIAARGGKDQLSEDEKKALVEMARQAPPIPPEAKKALAFARKVVERHRDFADAAKRWSKKEDASSIRMSGGTTSTLSASFDVQLESIIHHYRGKKGGILFVDGDWVENPKGGDEFHITELEFPGDKLLLKILNAAAKRAKLKGARPFADADLYDVSEVREDDVVRVQIGYKFK